jgi:hypothetical protein
MPHTCWASGNTLTHNQGADTSQAALHLMNGAQDSRNTWISIAYVFIAWTTYLDGAPSDKFPVDDLESLSITTDTLMEFIEHCNQPIITGLIASRLSDHHATLFVSHLFEHYIQARESALKTIVPLIIFTLLLSLPKSTFITDHIRMALYDHDAFSDICKGIISILLRHLEPVERSRKDEKGELMDILNRALSVACSHSGVCTRWQFLLESYAQMGEASTHCQQVLSESKTPILSSCDVYVIAIQHQLLDDGLIFHAWHHLVLSMSKITENTQLLVFVCRHLPSAFKWTSDVISASEKLEIMKNLCLIELATRYEEIHLKLIESCFCVLEEGIANEMIEWRWKTQPIQEERWPATRQRMVALFNRITGEFDPDLLLELRWLTFVAPKMVIANLVTVMARQKDSATRLVPNFLERTPISKLMIDPDRTILLDQLQQFIAQLDPLESDFDSASQNIMSTIPVITRIPSPQLQLPPILKPMDLTFFSVKSLLLEFLSLLKLPIHDIDSSHKVLEFLLKVTALDMHAFASALLKVGPIECLQPSIERFSEIMSLIAQWDSKLWESRYLRSSPLLALTNEILRIPCRYERFRTLCPFKMDMNVGRTKSAQRPFNEHNHLKLSWQTWCAIHSYTRDGKDHSVRDYLPVQLQNFLSSSSFDSEWPPGLVIDILYGASMGGEIGSEVSLALRRHLKSLEVQRRFKRSWSVASAWLLPRLAPSAMEAYFDCVSSSLCELGAWRCNWEDALEMNLSRISTLRAFSDLCRLLGALFWNQGGITRLVFGGLVIQEAGEEGEERSEAAHEVWANMLTVFVKKAMGEKCALEEVAKQGEEVGEEERGEEGEEYVSSRLVLLLVVLETFGGVAIDNESENEVIETKVRKMIGPMERPQAKVDTKEEAQVGNYPNRRAFPNSVPLNVFLLQLIAQLLPSMTDGEVQQSKLVAHVRRAVASHNAAHKGSDPETPVATPFAHLEALFGVP